MISKLESVARQISAIQTPTNIGLLEGRGVVDTISCYSYNLSSSLTTLHNNQLLLGRSTGKYNLAMISQNTINIIGCHVSQITCNAE